MDRLVRQQQGNGSLVTNIYDDAGQTTGIINAKSDGTVINRFSYTFDGAGNRLTKAETGGVRTTWTYDDTSQLIREQRNDANALDVTHIYDGVGNRTVQIDSGVRTTATYNAANMLLVENVNGARTTYSHDSCGNRTEKESPAATTYYTWDTCRNLVEVEPPAGKVTMTYNAAGKRVKKETASETKQFLYDYERLLQESDESDTVEKTYTSTQEQYGDLLSQYDGTDTHYHQYDSLGSTDALLNEAEMATDRYVYRAFGLQNHTTGNNDNALTFVGKQNYYRDSEADLYFLNARYYDPDAGRFISEDPIGYQGGDINLFRYVGNNPVNDIDPSGNALFVEFPGSGARSRGLIYLDERFRRCVENVRFGYGQQTRTFQGSDYYGPRRMFASVDFLSALPVQYWRDVYLTSIGQSGSLADGSGVVPATADYSEQLRNLYFVHSQTNPFIPLTGPSQQEPFTPIGFFPYGGHAPPSYGNMAHRKSNATIRIDTKR